MALSTANIKVSENKTSKTILPGNIQGRLYDLSLKPGYSEGSYYVILNIETTPVGDDFEGFLIDPRDESKGKFKGQVGRVRSGQYAFESKTLPNGNIINRDESIMKLLLNLAIAQGREQEMNEIEVDTIEELVEKAKSVLCNDVYLYYCIAAKEYTNKEGYMAYDCFLPKMANKKYVFGKNLENVVVFNETDHLIKEKKKETVSSFEPAPDGFNMF